MGEYIPFGEMNTKFLGGDSDHNYTGYVAQTIASWTQQPLGMMQQVRINFDAFDIEPTYDWVQLRDGAGSVLASYSGYHLGRWQTGWTASPTGVADIRFNADSINCGPTDPNCLNGPWIYAGVAVRNFEYQRYQSGAVPWFPPIRMPGQYRDEESQLFENWNRHYEPGTGHA